MEKNVLTNIDDIVFGVSLMGVILALSGEELSSANQLRAVEWLRDHGKGSGSKYEWCEYQLILLEGDSDYIVLMPHLDDFASFTGDLIKGVLTGDADSVGVREVLYACLVATAMYEAGVMISMGVGYKVVDSYCEKFLGVRSPRFVVGDDFSDEKSHDFFRLITAYNLYTSLMALGLEIFYVERLKRIIDDSYSLVEKLGE